MTEIRFIFNVPERLSYACRVVRKLYKQGQSIAIVGQQPQLIQMDQMLWTMTPNDFLAHSLLSTQGQEVFTPATIETQTPQSAPLPQAESTAISPRQSPIVLLEQPAHAHHNEVLVNLLNDVPSSFSHFSFLYELVSQYDEAEKQAARQRWRHYKQRGYVVVGHDLATKAAL